PPPTRPWASWGGARASPPWPRPRWPCRIPTEPLPATSGTSCEGSARLTGAGLPCPFSFRVPANSPTRGRLSPDKPPVLAGSGGAPQRLAPRPLLRALEPGLAGLGLVLSPARRALVFLAAPPGSAALATGLPPRLPLRPELFP